MKTSELTGAALDREVAKCEGKPSWIMGFSTEWEKGGPIIEREGLCLHRYKDSRPRLWSATYSAQDLEYFGPTPLIAAMRCYVASKLGGEVNVPEGLA